jgi:hypothetical protein
MDYGRTTVSAAGLATLGSAAYGSLLEVIVVLLVFVALAAGVRLFWRRGKALGDR